MASPADVLRDPNFQGLPIEERRKVLLSVDPQGFGGLAAEEQNKVLGGASGEPSHPPPPKAPIPRELQTGDQGTEPGESFLHSGARAAYEAKYGMPAPEDLGSGTPGMGPEMAVPGAAIGLSTGPGAFAASLASGYGASRGAKALGASEPVADILGGLVGMGVGGAYGKFAPGVLPQKLSPPTSKFLNMLPGKNYGDAVNEYLEAVHPSAPAPQAPEPFKPGPARNMPKYGGPADEGFSPPPQMKIGGWTPPDKSLVPGVPEPEAIPQAPEPFRPNPRIKKLLRSGPGSDYDRGMPTATATRAQRMGRTIADSQAAATPAVATEAAPVAPAVQTGGPSAPPGSVIVPPTEGTPSRYGDVGSKFGTKMAADAYAKDQAIAGYLQNLKLTPEQFDSATPEMLKSWAKAANPKYKGVNPDRIGDLRALLFPE